MKGPKILCGDDYAWKDGKGTGPGTAVDRFAKERNWKLHTVSGWFWYMIGEEEGIDNEVKSEL